ncbi:MAG: amidoligase family protein [Gammaproteobacteria bacterium]|nr:amidoligase family protein [Gammaproteobacteria bacterium]
MSQDVSSNARHLGIEIELAGVEPSVLTQAIVQQFGGEVKQHSAFEYQVVDSSAGKFIVELDAALIKQLGEHEQSQSVLTNVGDSLLKFAAEQFVPWEVVTPPLLLDDLPKVTALIDDLRQQGARGTRHAARYAFGLHLNPEVTATYVSSLLAHLRAYFCLYDWIVAKEQLDLSRRLTPYIDHFKADYIDLVLSDDYQPDRMQWMRDYIEFNPTRNRSLDCLPLIAHLDESLVAALDDRDLIKPRPTFHYRLPNCDIDNPDWNIDYPWQLWRTVERLANAPEKLAKLIQAFVVDRKRLTHKIDKQWVADCEAFLIAEDLLSDDLAQRIDGERSA